MTRKVEELESEVSQLSTDELREFREWFAAYDSAAWDEQIERDVKNGRLDALANAAITEHRSGKSTKL